MEVFRVFLIHLVEIIVLLTLILELLIFIIKIFQNEKGKRSLMLLLLLATVCVRDIMITLEVHPENASNDNSMFIIESTIIFLVFIIINTKEYFEKKAI